MAKKKNAPELSNADKLRVQIAQLCTQIGDRSFVIREANSTIVACYSQIDKLRNDLVALESANGPQAAK